MDIKQSRILPHSHPTIDRLRRHRWAAAAIGGVSLLGMVAAFAIAPPQESARVELTTILEQLPTPSRIAHGIRIRKLFQDRFPDLPFPWGEGYERQILKKPLN